MRRLLSAALLLLTLPAFANAQATLTGIVIDRQGSHPIAGATVAAPGGSPSTTTDNAGRFTLASDRPLTRVLVSAVGYTGREVPVSAGTTSLVIELEPAQTMLPGMQVVANKPAPSVSVLTAADLDRASGLSLENSINALPGLFMQSRTPWGGARITIRGYYPSTSGNSPNSNGLGYQVFLNDIPVTDATGTTVLDDIDYSTLGRVDVFKGPVSSQLGSYIGGAVMMSTARPTPNQTSITQQVISGTDGLLRTNSSLQSATSTSDLTLNYGHQAYDSFRPHSGSGKDYLRATGDFEVGGNQTVSTYVAYNRSFEELAGEIDSTDFYNRNPVSNAAYLANDSHIALTSFLAGVTDHYRITSDITNQTTLFGSGRTSNQPFAHGVTDVNQFNMGVRSSFGYTGRVEDVGINGALGLMAQRSNLTSNGVFIVPAPPYTQRPTAQENFASNLSLFTEWGFTLPSRTTLTAGGSLNRNQFGIRNMLKNNQLTDTTQLVTKTFDWVFTPRVALTQELSGTMSLYASASSGYTPPLLSNVIASNGTLDLSLKPERAVQYEVGAQGTALDGRLSGQVALFDVENSDKLVTQTANSVTFTTNAGKQRDQGAEVSLGYSLVDDRSQPLSLLRPWVSYSYTKATFVDFKSDNNNNAATVDFSGNAVPRVPRNMMTIGLDAAGNQGLSLNATWQYVDKVPVTFDNSTWMRSYDLLGAKVGYKAQLDRHWSLNLAAGGNNLLGSTYYSFLFVGPNYGGLAQAQDGGHGDGYIIPAPYNATFYGNIGLSYIF